MDIVYIITSSDIGGAQKHLISLCRGSLEQEKRVTVITGEYGYLTNALSTMGIQIIVEPSMKRTISPLHDLLAVVRIYRHLSLLKPKIVHCHSTKAGLVGRIAAKLSRIPVTVYTVHGFVFNDTSLTPRKKNMYILYERLCSRLSHRIITVSEMDKELALRYSLAKENKFKVIHNGIPEVFPKKSEIKTEHPVIGTVTRLVREKDMFLWLETAAKIKRALPLAKFIIVGDGPEQEKLMDYALTLGISDLEWAGEQENISSYLNQFDLFLLTSVKEGLPTTLLEALSSGVPIVSTNVGGVSEILTDEKCGIIVPTRSSDDLSAAVVLLLKLENNRDEHLIYRQEQHRLRFSETMMIESTFMEYHNSLLQKGWIW